MIDVAALDPADPGFVADPYPVFRALRERGPLHRHEAWGAHVAVSHELCSAVLRHRDLRRVWVDRVPLAEFEAFNALHRLSMLENERLHGRLRAAVAPLFHRRAVAAMRATTTELVRPRLDRLRAEIDEHGRAELMSALAGPVPVDVIAALLGFPPAEGPLLRNWSNRIVRMYEPELDDAGRRDAELAAGEFRGHVTEHVEHRRAHPGVDPLSALVGTGALDRDELVATCALLLMAGHEASVNGIGNAVVALHDRPAQWRLFRGLGPDAVATAVDELLRHDTPNQLFERTAVRPVELAGTRVEAGDKVVVLLGAANRDPTAFAAPDELDLTRTPNPHLALGIGMHYCLGAPLARLEIGVVLAEFAARFPDFALLERPRRSAAFALRGYDRIDITA
ncbi:MULTISPECIES: cytochrome P450 [unclassified Saccharopolyspora]|uniref:cytochrome P450 n=1 Tax=unclassified Saccharopolyspora TaxID=2646250 RepID=UPI001CD5FF9C|nr:MULTISPECIES: cytochrome P450 [unclassified Saccharopolyspora]MCA1189218.1 cytochrome P450 [Saccharopolyspora sp. 6T]MCA1192723.1 cytochrome P450 [Saccharopolyspora sp. 6V]MCA1226016.1 cytochrome P450 [Saccharopolyspora sp. 6M]MCA1279511.1 cytochrome P450 [Saccharopolyspora sp. 7B]